MTPEQINQFFSFLYRGTLGEIVFWWQLIAGVIVSALLGITAVIAVKFRELMKGTGVTVPLPDKLPPEPVDEEWSEVQKKISSANPSDWNLAVIHADSIFDGILKDMELPGETMGERLRQLDRSKLSSLNDIWEAHKIRNRIAHATDQILTHQEASRAVSLIERGLKELEYLEN